jgi:hypothetical protein
MPAVLAVPYRSISDWAMTLTVGFIVQRQIQLLTQAVERLGLLTFIPTMVFGLVCPTMTMVLSPVGVALMAPHSWRCCGLSSSIAMMHGRPLAWRWYSLMESSLWVIHMVVRPLSWRRRPLAHGGVLAASSQDRSSDRCGSSTSSVMRVIHIDRSRWMGHAMVAFQRTLLRRAHSVGESLPPQLSPVLVTGVRVGFMGLSSMIELDLLGCGSSTSTSSSSRPSRSSLSCAVQKSIPFDLPLASHGRSSPHGLGGL